uniref:Uncharacterized protein n=1 Tax=Rhizophora mucronata TaxID=61149 RepID=A0A2P2N385_RHIMU
MLGHMMGFASSDQKRRLNHLSSPGCKSGCMHLDLLLQAENLITNFSNQVFQFICFSS